MLQVLCLLVTAPRDVTLYVATDGNDAWSGRQMRPNSSKTDGPLASVTHARDLLRKLPKTVPVNVTIEAGTYRISKPIVFTPEDSGAPAAPHVYEGDGSRGMPLISGMRLITGWKRLPNGWLQAPVSGVKSGDWNFCQLFVNGQRRYRPRLPKAGYFTVAETVPPTEAAKGHGFDRFGFSPGQIRSDWANRDDVELLDFHIWGMSRNRIASVDEAKRVVTFKAPTGYDANWADLAKGNRFLVENVKEALSEPGEWYLDRPTGVLTYIPKPGETLRNLKVEAPVADSLIEFRGDLKNRRWVENIRVAALRLEGSNWNLPPTGRNFPQAEADLAGAVRLEGARHCEVGGCDVAHTGGYGIEVGAACKHIEMIKNGLSDLGAGGFKVGEMAYVRDPELLTERCNIGVNAVRGGGRLHPAAVGVWVGQNPYIHVGGNFISDLYYTGISVGWSWGYQENGAHDNVIEGNRIAMIGQGVLSDMGGIYTLGPQPGTIIRNNRIHDVRSYSYGGWGIYPDEGSSGMLIENNCVYRTKSAGFHQHYGKENIVRNNVFAFGGEAQIMRTRAEDHLSFTFDHNLVIFDRGSLLGSNWSGNNYRLDDNVYWRSAGKPFDFAGMSLDQWRAKGQDAHSVVADPLFKNPAKGDFELLSGSPAAAVGFKESYVFGAGFEGGEPHLLPRAFP